MNKAYRLIWSQAKDAWVIVAEIVKGNGGPPPITIAAVIAATMALLAGNADALPTGQQVVSGAVSFATSIDNKTLTITNSPNSIINWQGFSIAAGERTTFNQQNASSAVLNRVIGAYKSDIFGMLDSNGKVFLINPSGVLFGAGSQINVAGLVASSLGMTNQDFINGNYRFTGDGQSGFVTNQGNITTAAGGKVWLIAPQVENQGIINAPNGDVLLAAGQSVHLVDPNNPEVAVVVSAPTDAALNLGTIAAQAGKTGIFGGLVNQQGIINANSAVTGPGGRIFLKSTNATTLGSASVTSANARVSGDGGRIVALSDGETKVAGTLSATGGVNGGNGGFIETSGSRVKIADNAIISTLAPNGKTGTWLVDPNDFTIAATGGDITGTQLSTNLGSNNVVIESADGTINTGGNGDIFVNDSVSWTSANSLTLNAVRNIDINQPVSLTDGTLLLRADKGGTDIGTVNFGYNGNVTISGSGRTDLYYNPLSYDNPTNYSANIIGPYTAWMLVNNIGQQSGGTHGLQAVNTNLAGNFALGKDIDASATQGWSGGEGDIGFTPLGDSNSPFTGKFDGNGHTITSLSTDLSYTDYVGLFGYVFEGLIKNVGLLDSSVRGFDNVGSLVGYNQNGTIESSYSTGSVSGNQNVGSLVGYNSNGAIDTSYSTGSVNGSFYVGGLVGYNDGGAVRNSFSLANVISSGDYAGGLVGYNDGGTINDTFAHGNVSANDYVGGLAGDNAGDIANSYSSGRVITTSSTSVLYAGGLVGRDVTDGGIVDSYWNTETSGLMSSSGGMGLTTAEMTSATDASTNFSGFDFTNTWNIRDGGYPSLRFAGTAPSDWGVKNNWTGGGGGVSWKNPLNWSAGHTPTGTENVTIGTGSTITASTGNIWFGSMDLGSDLTIDDTVSGFKVNNQLTLTSGTATFDAETTVGSLNLVNGTLAGTGSFTVETEFLQDASGIINRSGSMDVTQVSGTLAFSADDVGDLTLRADSMDLGTINAPSVLLTSVTPALPIDLMSGPKSYSGSLELTASELGGITANSLTIGDASSGDININTSLTLTTVSNLNLVSGSAASINVANSVEAPNLSLTAGTINQDAGTTMSAAGTISLTADAMNLLGSAGSIAADTVALAPYTYGGYFYLDMANGVTINDSSTVFWDTISANTRIIGSANAGNIDVNDSIDISDTSIASNNLQLISDTVINQNGNALTAPGSITLKANTMSLSGGIDAPLVTLTRSSSGNIDLGTDSLSGALVLTQGDIDSVQYSGTDVPGVLRIGDLSNVQNINITGTNAITRTDANNDTLHLSAGSSITQAVALEVTNLALDTSYGDVSLANIDNKIDYLAANVPYGNIDVTSSAPFRIGSVDGIDGISTYYALTLRSDQLDIDQAINAHDVTLTALSSAWTIDLVGTKSSSTALELSATDLGKITASNLNIGDASSDDININAPIELANVNSLNLVSGGAINQTAGSTMAVTNINGTLSLTADTMNLAGGNSSVIANTVALAALTAGTAISVDAAGVTIGTSSQTTWDTISADTRIIGSSAAGPITVNGAVNLNNMNGVVNTFSSNLALVAGSSNGAITINAPITTPGDLTLNTVGAVTQASSSGLNIITAAGLELRAASYTQNDNINTIDTLAANIPALSFSNSKDLNIGTVGNTTGIYSPGGTVTLDVPVANTVTQDTYAPITAASLELLTGSFTLDSPYNSISTLAGDAAAITFVNSQTLSVGTVNSTIGVTANDDINLTATGFSGTDGQDGIVVNNLVMSTNGSVTLTGIGGNSSGGGDWYGTGGTGVVVNADITAQTDITIIGTGGTGGNYFGDNWNGGSAYGGDGGTGIFVGNGVNIASNASGPNSIQLEGTGGRGGNATGGFSNNWGSDGGSARAGLGGAGINNSGSISAGVVDSQVSVTLKGTGGDGGRATGGKGGYSGGYGGNANINVSGSSYGSGGAGVISAGPISVAGTGTVTITGTGGAGGIAIGGDAGDGGYAGEGFGGFGGKGVQISAAVSTLGSIGIVATGGKGGDGIDGYGGFFSSVPAIGGNGGNGFELNSGGSISAGSNIAITGIGGKGGHATGSTAAYSSGNEGGNATAGDGGDGLYTYSGTTIQSTGGSSTTITLSGNGGFGGHAVGGDSDGSYATGGYAYGGHGGHGILHSGQVGSYNNTATVVFSGNGGFGGNATAGNSVNGDYGGGRAIGGDGAKGAYIDGGSVFTGSGNIIITGNGGNGGFGKGGSGVEYGDGGDGSGGNGDYGTRVWRGNIESDSGNIHIIGIGGNGGNGFGGIGGNNGSGGYGGGGDGYSGIRISSSSNIYSYSGAISMYANISVDSNGMPITVKDSNSIDRVIHIGGDGGNGFGGNGGSGGGRGNGGDGYAGLDISSSSVTTYATGDITLIATGGSGGIGTGGDVLSAGYGGIGSGGNGGSGIYLNYSLISSSAGAIKLTGYGGRGGLGQGGAGVGTGGNANDIFSNNGRGGTGIHLYYAGILSDSGEITLNGFGGKGGDSFAGVGGSGFGGSGGRGIHLEDYYSGFNPFTDSFDTFSILSGSGAVKLAGTGGRGGYSSGGSASSGGSGGIGVHLQSGYDYRMVEANAAIAIKGYGGIGGDSNGGTGGDGGHGFFVEQFSDAVNSSAIKSSTNVTLTGKGAAGGTGEFNGVNGAGVLDNWTSTEGAILSPTLSVTAEGGISLKGSADTVSLANSDSGDVDYTDGSNNNYTDMDVSAANTAPYDANYATGGNVSITSNNRNIVVGTDGISAKNRVDLIAQSGAIIQYIPGSEIPFTSGAIITPALITSSAAGTDLSNPTNTVAAFTATNTSSDGIILKNRGVLSIDGIINGVSPYPDGGLILVDNVGATTINGVITSTGSTVDITAHSPLTVNSNVTGNGTVTLFAGASGSANDNLTINSLITSTAGDVILKAGHNVIVDGVTLPATDNLVGNLLLTAAPQSGKVVIIGDLNPPPPPPPLLTTQTAALLPGVTESISDWVGTMGNEATDLSDEEPDTNEGETYGTEFSALPFCN